MSGFPTARRVRIPKAGWCLDSIIPHRHLPDGNVLVYPDRARDKLSGIRWMLSR